MQSFRNSYFLPVCLVSALAISPLSVKAENAAAEQSEAPSQAAAEGTPAEADQQASEERAPEKIELKAGPKLKELEEYTGELLKGLQPHEAQYIFQIRQEFGVIRSIQVVRSDISNAVASCGEKNPEIKDRISARFEKWEGDIMPKLGAADAALKDAIQRQSFRPTVRINMLLDHVQEAFEERDSQIKKVPVTTLDACEKLLESMDGTEGDLKKLIDETTSVLTNLSLTPPETAAVQDQEAPAKAP